MSYFHAFLEKSYLALLAQGKKYHVFGKKRPSFQIMQERSWRVPSLKDHLFKKFEENITLPSIFLREIIFHFLSKCKIIFSGKRNMIFPDNTMKIIFQPNFFWKYHLFRTSGKRKYGFPCSAN